MIRVLRRLVLSAAIAAVVIGVAMRLALFVTSWPKWLSLAIEPLEPVADAGGGGVHAVYGKRTTMW